MPGEVDKQTILPPPVLWAQRKNLVYIKIALEDCLKPTIKVEKDKLYFKGVGGSEKKEYEVTLNLFGEIKPDESKYSVQGRGIEFVLIKAENEPSYWKRLLQNSKKEHWLKIDFEKWKDEDDTDDEASGGADGGDFESMMRQMGGMSGLGGDTAGLENLENMDNLSGSEESDDDLPELEN